MMKRIAFDLEEQAIVDLDKLVEKAGLSNRKDLLNEALSFFEYCLDNARRSGSLPMVVNEEGRTTEVAGAPFTRAKKAFETEKATKKPQRSADKLPMTGRTAIQR